MVERERMRRTHVVLPEGLLAKIDELVGKRERSRFIAEVLDAEVRRRRLSIALDEMDGFLADEDIPGWETPEAAVGWVRAIRSGAPVRSADLADQADPAA